METVREVSQSEVFAGLIWHFCINSQDHFYKGEYYDLPVSFQYDNDGVSLLDVYYLQQRNQWSLISPDYKHILRIAPLVLKWLDDTYFAYVSSKQQARVLRSPRKRRRRSIRKRAMSPFPSILGSPLSQPQSFFRQATKPKDNNGQGNNQENNRRENQEKSQNNRG